MKRRQRIARIISNGPGVAARDEIDYACEPLSIGTGSGGKQVCVIIPSSELPYMQRSL